MSRDYQNDRLSYDPYNQDYDSGYSGQTNEYRDLYNPYKSLWRQAIKARIPKQHVGGKANYFKHEDLRKPNRAGEVLHGQTQHRATGGPGYERVNQPEKYTPYGKLTQGEEQVFDSGYDVTRRNTYGNQTTGYGPRD